MKKKLSLLIALSALTLSVGAAVGLGAGVKGAEEAKADDTTVTLYINHFDGGGSWNNFGYYLFGTGGDNGTFGSVHFTDDMKTATPNEFDQYQYVLTIDTSVYQKLILFGNPKNWGGSQAQTEDLIVTSMTKNGLYCGDQIPDTAKFDVGYYTYSTKTVYMLDLAGNVYNENHYCHTFADGKTGTTWPGAEMTKVSGTNNLYSVEINSALDNVQFNNYDKGTKSASHQTVAIGSAADGNVYIVYPDNGYNTFTSSDALNAAKFIDKFMKFETRWTDVEGTGECLSLNWYTNARDEFRDNLSDEEKAIVLTHEPTTARLAAWATAKGETFNPSSGAFNSIVATAPIAIESAQANYTAVIILASTLALIAVGGYFLLRKARKED